MKQLKKLAGYQHSHITMSLADNGLIVLRQVHDGKERKGTDEILLDSDEWDQLKAVEIPDTTNDEDEADDEDEE